jgi:hypothetical protein
MAHAAAGAAASTDCPVSANPYAYSADQLESCGYTVYQATVSPLPGGGEQYSYSGQNGIFASTAMPPSGFDPTTASAAQLAEYGYPPRPAPPQSDATWTEMVSIPRSQPEPFLAQAGSANAGASFDATSYDNKGWSGFITNPDAGNMTVVDLFYTQPNYLTSNCGKSDAADWAGLGGGPGVVNGSDLVQTGTWFSSGLSGTLAPRQPWWEDYTGTGSGGITAYPQGGTPSAGDSLIASVELDGTGYAYYSIYDDTSGQVWTVTKLMQGNGPDPDTAEAVVERPPLDVDNTLTYYSLSKFAQVDGQALAGTALNEPMSEFSYSTITMTSNGESSGTTLATPFGLNSEGVFNVDWDACS